MQNDRSQPPERRYNYRNVFEGLSRMTRDEGVSSLFRGAVPNVSRAMLMTASQLASYDEFKRLLKNTGAFQEGLLLHFTSSVAAGFIATTVCSPVDVVKTRIMSAKDQSKGIMQILTEAMKTEGPSFMFRGWTPAFVRLGPHTVATFLALEQHKKLYLLFFET